MLPTEGGGSGEVAHGAFETEEIKALVEGPGALIGPYKILQEIGEGGMGVVYMAEQLEPVRRRVALKIIKLGMDTRHVIARFEAERQALAMMDHPNIAKVLDAGATDSGRPYFIMELVRGIPITDYCDKNKLGTRRRVELFIQVCRAVQHAHQKGIIHRDLKPSNVMVTLHDGVPIPKVIDFGIAKATTQQLTEKTLFTNYGQMIGTPAYVSPEQAEMSGLDIDTRSDIYSLGVVLYELLTGKTPISREELKTASPGALQRLIRDKEPPKPSTCVSTLGEELSAIAASRGTEAGKLGKLISGDLDWIVMKCLEKDRTRRYETANALALDLERTLNNESITARPPTTLYQLQRFVRRNRALALSAALVVASLAAGATISTWQWIRAEEKADFAQQQTEIADAAKGEADRRAGELAELNRRQYFFNMRVAAKELAAGNVNLFREIVDQYREVPPGVADLRGWEWHYLQSEAQQAETVLRGHRGRVTACAWSPDGGLVASAGVGGELILWDPDEGKRIRVLERRDVPWRALAWSTSKNRLAAIDEDFAIVVWDMGQMRRIAELRGHFSTVRSISWCPDGDRIVSGGSDRQLVVWDVEKGSVIASEATYDGVAAVAWRPTEEADVIAYSYDDELGQIFLWDLAREEHRRLSRGEHRGGVGTLAWGDDGRHLAVGSGSKGITIWEVDERSYHNHATHVGAVFGLAWHPQGEKVASVGSDSVLRVWRRQGDRVAGEGDEAEPELALIGHRGFIRAVAWDPGGERLVTGGDDGSVRIWDPRARGSGRLLVEQLPSWAWMLSWSSDGSSIAASGPYFDEIPVIDVVSGDVHHLRGVGDLPFTVLSDPGASSRLAIGSNHGLRLWDGSTAQPLGDSIPASREMLVLVAWSPDGKYVLSRYWDGGLPTIWDLESSSEHAVGLTLPESQGDRQPDGFAARWSPDGKWLATGGFGGTVDLWDGQTFAWQRNLRGGGGDVIDLDFSPDGSRLVIGDESGVVEVYGVDGTLLYSKQSHQNKKVKSIRWRPGPKGDRIASGGQDGYVRLIDSENFDLALEIRADPGEVYRIEWSPDGETLAGTGEGDWVRLWSGSEGQGAPPVSAPGAREDPKRELLRSVITKAWGRTHPVPEGSALEESLAALEKQTSGARVDPFHRGTRLLLATLLGEDQPDQLSQLLDGEVILPGRNQQRLKQARIASWRRQGELSLAAEGNRALLGFPPRADGTPGHQIDLSSCYTERLDADLHLGRGNNLEALLDGTGEFKTPVAYDIRGIVHLSCTNPDKDKPFPTPPDDYPERVEDIPVFQKCGKLYFLHASGMREEEAGTRIGHLLIHLEDRPPEKVELVFTSDAAADTDMEPIKPGEARTWDWWLDSGQALPEETAWVGVNRAIEESEGGGRQIALFELEWVNPSPDATVETIDFVSSMSIASPFLVAITAEPPE